MVVGAIATNPSDPYRVFVEAYDRSLVRSLLSPPREIHERARRPAHRSVHRPLVHRPLVHRPLVHRPLARRPLARRPLRRHRPRAGHRDRTIPRARPGPRHHAPADRTGQLRRLPLRPAVRSAPASPVRQRGRHHLDGGPDDPGRRAGLSDVRGPGRLRHGPAGRTPAGEWRGGRGHPAAAAEAVPVAARLRLRPRPAVVLRRHPRHLRAGGPPRGPVPAGRRHQPGPDGGRLHGARRRARLGVRTHLGSRDPHRGAVPRRAGTRSPRPVCDWRSGR